VEQDQVGPRHSVVSTEVTAEQDSSIGQRDNNVAAGLVPAANSCSGSECPIDRGETFRRTTKGQQQRTGIGKSQRFHNYHSRTPPLKSQRSLTRRTEESFNKSGEDRQEGVGPVF
jgi:hypothetical protein